MNNLDYLSIENNIIDGGITELFAASILSQRLRTVDLSQNCIFEDIPDALVEGKNVTLLPQRTNDECL